MAPKARGRRKGMKRCSTKTTHLHVEKWEGIWMRATTVMVVVFILAIIVSATAFGITVPGVSGRIDPTKLNDPGSPFAQPGLRELAPGKYEAYMVAQTWNFLPDKIEVPVGSEVTFHLTARDVTHGFKLTGHERQHDGAAGADLDALGDVQQARRVQLHLPRVLRLCRRRAHRPPDHVRAVDGCRDRHADGDRNRHRHGDHDRHGSGACGECAGH